MQEPAAADLHRVGVIARIVQVARLANGTTRVLVEGIARARVTRYSTRKLALRGTIAPSPLSRELPAADAAELDARSVERCVRGVRRLHRRIPPEVVSIIQRTGVPERAASIVARTSACASRYASAARGGLAGEMFDELTEQLSAEIELLRLERKIDDDVRGSLFQNQREFYLQEQLKAIHRELGQDDGDDLGELEAQVEEEGCPTRCASARARGAQAAPDVAAAPRGHRRAQLRRLDPRAAVDRAHRRRARRRARAANPRRGSLRARGSEGSHPRLHRRAVARRARSKGPILCLVGPPGVGKTSLGRSIARALGRKFVRMSLGGVRDEAEIRGHRRTYIGSMPGRVIQAMRRAEVVNPVHPARRDRQARPGLSRRSVGGAARGARPGAEQRVQRPLPRGRLRPVAGAVHHDGELPAAIPEPLRDRMEIIRLAGYLDQEKLAIARQFLVPKQLERTASMADSVALESDVVPARRARLHARSRRARARAPHRPRRAQARSAPRRARERRAGRDPEAQPTTVDNVRADELKELLGVAPYDPDDMSLDDKVGVAIGLAYTSVGGEVLEIEVSVVPGRGQLQLTGTLGDVMKESASAALSYARSRAGRLASSAISTRRAICTCTSPPARRRRTGRRRASRSRGDHQRADRRAGARRRRDDRRDHAARPRAADRRSQGEVVAAHRNGIRHVIIPQQNARDLEELPEEVRDGLTFHPVKTMDEVLALALRHFRQRVHRCSRVQRRVAVGSRGRRRRRPTSSTGTRGTATSVSRGKHRALPIRSSFARSRSSAEWRVRRRRECGVPAWRPAIRCPKSRSPAGRTSASRRCSTRSLRGSCAREQHAGPHARDQLLQGERRVRARRPAGLRLRAHLQRRTRRVAAAHRGLSAPDAELRGIVLLLDVRHEPTNDDRQMLDFLAESGVPIIVALTKIDKLTAGAAAQRVEEISAALGLEPDQVIPFSAVTGEGRDELAEALVELRRS